MDLRELILKNNDCYKAGRTIIPKGVMIHSTGANNPWLKRYVGPDDGALGANIYGNHWNRPGLSVCAHAFIGKLENGSVATYKTLPWDMRGWHCGRSGNDTHIGIEVCEDNLEDRTYFDAVYREAAELTAALCEHYNLDPMASGVVLSHKEGNALGIASNHGDIDHWLAKHEKTMDDFRGEVAKIMGGGVDMTTEELTRIVDTRIALDRETRTYGTQANVPAWGKATVDKLIAKGALKGDGDGLNISYDLLRALVVLDRCGAFG